MKDAKEFMFLGFCYLFKTKQLMKASNSSALLEKAQSPIQQRTSLGVNLYETNVPEDGTDFMAY